MSLRAMTLNTVLPREICSILISDEDFTTVAVLARTCRAFFEPAIDALWRSLPSLALLLYLLPRDAWTVSFEKTASRTLSFQRALVPSDFSRFHIYTPRVRVLGATHGHTRWRLGTSYYKLSREALQTLYASRPTPLLFPNLRRLEPIPHITSVASMLFAPHMESVALRIEPDFDEDPRALYTLLRLPEKSPNVTRLVIKPIFTSSPLIADAVMELASALKDLTVFSMQTVPVSAAALPVLAGLPELKWLDLYIKVDLESDLPRRLIGRDAKASPFHKLATLLISVDDMEYATELLTYVSSPRLSVLQIRCPPAPSAPRMEALFKVVSSHISSRRLRRLQIDAVCPDATSESDISNRRLTNSMLLPLLNLRLESLMLTGFLVDIDDDVLNSMAIAWPELQRLSLGVGKTWGEDYPPRATILGITPFIKHCRNIEFIGYRMQTDVFDPGRLRAVEGRPGKGTTTDNIVELDVGDSRIHDPVEVASFLSDVCPKLWYIGSLWRSAEEIEDNEEEGVDTTDEEDMHDKWDSVTDYVPQFALIRTQERSCTP
ncbi:hypothetical protein DAEQUDRAFT_807107 [Daedalea quercina L-15889]|uniref:F-box domain-containing protein n=1 Tax=Daedalea quercina L-15889 TaxID=1314783 RepID=A0A165UEE7_9APHY|nr:hypothetical protein DAEQUDRAFT_807107 [Daedalea quercina L-15889]